MKQFILYNPISGKKDGASVARRLAKDTGNDAEETVLMDITKIESYEVLRGCLTKDDRVIICGGDGTLNRFVNAAGPETVPCEIYYQACGTGNDFLRDIRQRVGKVPINITKYLKNLPTVTVRGRSYRFLNNVGFGLDGYCTEEGDRLREKTKAKVNYTMIAVKGLFGRFKPVNATVTVDGVTRTFKDVWLAPTMNGRFYGGGVMATPEQDRTNGEGIVSVMVYHTNDRLKTILGFPTILRGKHTRYKDMVEIFTGKYVRVEFDRPTPLQIDGETLRDVIAYEIGTPKEQNI